MRGLSGLVVLMAIFPHMFFHDESCMACHKESKISGKRPWSHPPKKTSPLVYLGGQRYLPEAPGTHDAYEMVSAAVRRMQSTRVDYGTMREIVLFEIMRAYFLHPFNRYAWVIIHDRDGAEMDYYSREVLNLGAVLSLTAKLAINADNKDF